MAGKSLNWPWRFPAAKTHPSAWWMPHQAIFDYQRIRWWLMECFFRYYAFHHQTQHGFPVYTFPCVPRPTNEKSVICRTKLWCQRWRYWHRTAQHTGKVVSASGWTSKYRWHMDVHLQKNQRYWSIAMWLKKIPSASANAKYHETSPIYPLGETNINRSNTFHKDFYSEVQLDIKSWW